MRKTLVILFSVLLLFSCRSTDSVQYTKDEIRNALMSLSSDMFMAVDLDSPVDAERIKSALPLTYTAYSRYVPLYDDIAEDYSQRLSVIITPFLKDALHLVRDSASVLAESGSDAFIHDDTAFTEGIRSRIGESVAIYYGNEIRRCQDELDDAFQPSYTDFSAVRGAYLNLSAVGHATYISEPEMIDAELAGRILSDTLFDRLAECERTLKNTPAGISSGYYYVFWGGH